MNRKCSYCNSDLKYNQIICNGCGASNPVEKNKIANDIKNGITNKIKKERAWPTMIMAFFAIIFVIIVFDLMQETKDTLANADTAGYIGTLIGATLLPLGSSIITYKSAKKLSSEKLIYKIIGLGIGVAGIICSIIQIIMHII